MAAITSQTNLLRPTSHPSPISSSPIFVSLPRKGTTISSKAVNKPTILVADKISTVALDVLKEFGNVDCSYNMSHEELCAKVVFSDALIVRSGTKVTKAMFESSAGRLRIVARVGVVNKENVDLAAATEHGCLVVNAFTVNTVAAPLKAGKWQRKNIGASTVEAQVLAELPGYMELAEKLARLAIQLVAGGGSTVKSVKVTYESALDLKDLDTWVLRPMIIKGLIEHISGDVVNLVNADIVAKQHGIRITEERVQTDRTSMNPIEYIQVQIAQVDSKFPTSTSETGEITVTGRVKDGIPHLTSIGSFQVDMSLQGSIILCRQVDQDGMIGAVTSVLGEQNVNVSAARQHAIIAIGVEKEPTMETLTKISKIPAIEDFVFLKL